MKKIVIGVVFTIVIVIYFGTMIYSNMQAPQKYMVVNGTIELDENVTGYVVRNEKVVTADSIDEILSPVATEGTRVAKGELIASFSQKSEDEYADKVKELDIKIQEAMKNNNESYFSSDVKSIDEEIKHLVCNISGYIDDFEKLKKTSRDLNDKIFKKAKISGELSPAGSYIKKLMDQRYNYETKMNNARKNVYAPFAGIVSYKIDGYEDVLTKQSILGINMSQIEKMKINDKVLDEADERLKVIDNYEMYVVACGDSAEFQKAKVGGNVNIRLLNGELVDAKIESVVKEKNKVTISLKIIDDTEYLAEQRKIDCEVVWWKHSGYKVPNRAIQKIGNDNYVDVQNINTIEKVKVNVVKSNETFSIITAGNGKLSLYDEIVYQNTK